LSDFPTQESHEVIVADIGVFIQFFFTLEFLLLQAEMEGAAELLGGVKLTIQQGPGQAQEAACQNTVFVNKYVI